MSENLGTKRVSKLCDANEIKSTHKKGIYYFYISFLFLISSLLVGLAKQIFSVNEILWLGWSLFYILGIIINIGFWIFVILGFYNYTKCDVKEITN
ncbi:MAG: hypothetical protein WC934_02940 [Acidithiobacillus sp.]|jgi:hypothetical protein|uniref:hypothetical protein n=1 Tax=Acidithiobacillus sp. TaxID=1872118 RepID=UPI003560604E